MDENQSRKKRQNKKKLLNRKIRLKYILIRNKIKKKKTYFIKNNIKFITLKTNNMQ